MLDFSDRDAKPASAPAVAGTAQAPAESVQELPRVGTVFRHYKGNLYRVEGISSLEATGEPALTYRSLDPLTQHQVWTRAWRDFSSSVTLAGGLVPRFSKVHQPGEDAMRHYAAQAGVPDSVIAIVRAHHQESHRFYHGWSHILDLFERARDNDVELSADQVVAILFHDIVYVPGAPAGSNETLSALLLRSYAAQLGAHVDIERTARIIEDTAQHIPTQEESKVVLDLDLSSLAADAVSYCAYNELVWLENRHLLASAASPRKDFDTRRLKFLLALAARGPLFQVLTHLEDTARENLEGLRKAWVANYGTAA